MKIIQSIVTSLVFVLLVSCAQAPKKEPVVVEEPKAQQIKIDADVETDFNQALVHLKLKEYDQAIALLKAVVEVEKRVPAPYTNLGIAYVKKEDRENAEKYLLSALKIELTHPIANNQLGLLYRKNGRFNDAKKAYTNALTEHPDYLPIVKNLGILCELYMRDLVCALAQYEHYLSLQPDDKTMKIWVADVTRRVKK